MKRKLILLGRSYGAALRKFLETGASVDLLPAVRVGRKAVALRMETLEFARMHEQTMTELKMSPSSSGRQNQREEKFFTEALSPIVETHHAAQQCKIDLKKMNETLIRRTIELAGTHRQLQRGIHRRKSVEAALKKTAEHYTRLLKHSLQLQHGLRHLTHQVLASQEEQRKELSGELHNDIAQSLLGI